jgi:oxygen-independent coproporphyrinogen III oxidase
MSVEERLRKGVVLNLVPLDRAWFIDLLGKDPLDIFADEFTTLAGIWPHLGSSFGPTCGQL